MGTDKRKRAAALAAALLVCAALFASGASPADPAPPEEDRPMVGMAKVDMTPDVGARKVRLNGYADRYRKPARGVHDPLSARALVVEGANGGKFAIVGVDLCFSSAELRARVLELLAPYGFTDDNLLIAATHTHSGFAGYDGTKISFLLMGPFDPKILEFAAQRIAAAVLEANSNLRPVTWERVTTTIPNMNRSRLDPAFEMGEVDGPGDEAVYDHEKYPVSEDLTAFRFTGEDGQVVGAVVHFAAHPTVLSGKNMELSADYPGVLCDRIEQSLGAGSTCLFLNATIGDTAPTPDWVDDVSVEYKMMEEYGTELADRMVEAMTEMKPIGEPEVAAHTERREFSRVTLRKLYRWTLPTTMSRLFYTSPTAPLQAIRLGDVALLAVPGEPTTAVGRRIKEACPEGMQCLIVAPSNQYLGYLVSDAEYEGGTYAADSCFFGPDGVRRVEEGVQAALARVVE